MDYNPFRQRRDEKTTDSEPFSEPYPSDSNALSGHLPPAYSPPAYPLPQNSKQGERSFPGEASAYYNSTHQSASLSTHATPPQTGGHPQSFLGNSVDSSNFKRNPLNPPPTAFTRPISPYIDPRPFPPLSITSLGSTLHEGFPRLPPASEVPLPFHPFSTHDVPEADWLRFLEDIDITASLTDSNKINPSSIPSVMPLSLSVHFLKGTRSQDKMKSEKIESVTDLIDMWNQYFFKPRRVCVYLTQGKRILSSHQGGDSHTVPLGHGMKIAKGSHHGSDSSDSSSSSDSSDSDPLTRREGKRIMRAERRQARRERRDQRREEKRERKDKRRENRQERKEMKKGKNFSKHKFSLVVVPN